MEPFLGEVRIFSFGWAPNGWALCNGALLPIAQFTALFSILGTAYGGDGRTNFRLPDFLGGRVPLGAGQGPGRTDRERGDVGGAIGVQLEQTTIPAHVHAMNATNSPADVSSPTATTALARSTGKSAYAAAASLTNLNAGAVGTLPSGGSPHNNLMPFLVLNYCIALQGVFPQRP